MPRTNFDSRMPPSVVYFEHILNLTSLQSRVNVTVQLHTFAHLHTKKWPSQCKRQQITLVYSLTLYTTITLVIRCRKAAQKKYFPCNVLAATNDTTYERASTFLTSKLYTSSHNIAMIALIIFEVVSAHLEIPFDRGWPW